MDERYLYHFQPFFGGNSSGIGPFCWIQRNFSKNYRTDPVLWIESFLWIQSFRDLTEQKKQVEVEYDGNHEFPLYCQHLSNVFAIGYDIVNQLRVNMTAMMVREYIHIYNSML